MFRIDPINSGNQEIIYSNLEIINRIPEILKQNFRNN